ncbi:hypothetical protein GP486_007835, partial [Trichoglossum hirsutum]
YSLRKIWKLLGRPPCFLIDFRPIIPPLIVVTDPKVAEEISRPSSAFPYSLGKDEGCMRFKWVLGSESIVLTEGEEWKELRRRFNPAKLRRNPGFQPSHLHSLIPLMLRKTRIFTNKLRTAAASQAVVTFGNYVQDLTVDIIGEVVVEHDLRAQLTEEGEGEKGPGGVLMTLDKILEWTYNEQRALNPFHRFSILRPIMLRYYSRILDRRLSEIIHSRIETRKPESATRTILNLALQDVTGPLSSQLHKLTVTQIKSLIFAGSHTTASTVQWITYLISKHPSILAKVRAEHDVIFGDRPVEEVLAKTPKEALSAMVYTTAVIKETLRLYSPAGSVRSAPAGSGFGVTVGGMRMRLDGTMLFVNHHIIHQDEKVGKEKARSTAHSHLKSRKTWMI